MRMLPWCLVIGVILGSCSNPTEESQSVAQLTTDRGTYVIGDVAILKLYNTSTESLKYNLCFSAAERRERRSWSQVSLIGYSVPCLALMAHLGPGEQDSWSIPISEFVSPGTFRIRNSVELSGHLHDLVTAEFAVRSSRE
jgi:hypothetical protein